VGLRAAGRVPVRAGAKLFAGEDAQAPIGAVTSGSFGPSVAAPVAMGYAAANLAAPGTPLLAEVRGSRIAVTVCDLPFVPTRYKRS
jgi:aminomethyltransferase